MGGFNGIGTGVCFINKQVNIMSKEKIEKLEELFNLSGKRITRLIGHHENSVNSIDYCVFHYERDDSGSWPCFSAIVWFNDESERPEVDGKRVEVGEFIINIDGGEFRDATMTVAGERIDVRATDLRQQLFDHMFAAISESIVSDIKSSLGIFPSR